MQIIVCFFDLVLNKVSKVSKVSWEVSVDWEGQVRSEVLCWRAWDDEARMID